MTFPQIGVDVIDKLMARFPSLIKNPDGTFVDDVKRRLLTRMIAEQMVFQTLDNRWGVKSVSEGAVQGKDGIAWDRQDGTIDIWDWQNGTTRKRQVNTGDSPHHPAEHQFFIKVMPINHLEGIIMPPPDDVDWNFDEMMKEIKEIKTSQQSYFTRLLEFETVMAQALAGISQNLNEIHSKLRQIEEKPVPAPVIKYPSYRGSLGLRLNLDPYHGDKPANG